MKSFPNSKCFLPVFLALLVSYTASICAQTEALADFSGGLGESAPNEFPGSAGQGWTEGWKTAFGKANREDFTFEIIPSASFEGNPSTLVTSRLNGLGFARISRILDSSVIDPSESHTIKFQICADVFTEAGSQPLLFTIGGTPQEKTSAGPSESAWSLVVIETSGTWGIYYGDGSGQLLRKNTGVPLVLGTVYTITIQVFPNEKAFQVKIESPSHFFESEQLLSPNPDPRSEALSFGGWTRGNTSGTFQWSLGPVRVQKN